MKISKRGKGSALVGAVAIAAFLLITAAGFIRVVTNESIYEALAYNNDCAFTSAESGALLGAKWLAYPGNFQPDQQFMPFKGLKIPDNGFYVDVKINTSLNGNQLAAEIISEAYSHPTDRNENTFHKRIIYNAQPMSFGAFGTFFDHADNNWAGFWNRTFNGTFHMNERIIIHSFENRVTFSERVTIANEPGTGHGYGIGGPPYYNDYNYGVQINNSRPYDNPVDALDNIFLKEYLPNQPEILLPKEITDLTKGLPSHSDALELPVSTRDEGQRYSHYRPTLKFNDNGSATYIYRNGGIYDTFNIGSVNEKVIVSKNNVNVFGVVNGNTTLVTTTGNSIVIVDDLIYEDYDPTDPNLGNNWGQPIDSKNVLGLVAGEDISFVHKWIKEIDGSYYKVRGNIVNPVDDPASEEIGELHVNASMLALRDDCTERWDRSKPYYFDLFLTGNHILDLWYPPSTAGGSTHGGAHNITFNHDQRLINLIQPHGFPLLNIQGGLLMILLSGWTEENNLAGGA